MKKLFCLLISFFTLSISAFAVSGSYFAETDLTFNYNNGATNYYATAVSGDVYYYALYTDDPATDPSAGYQIYAISPTSVSRFRVTYGDNLIGTFTCSDSVDGRYYKHTVYAFPDNVTFSPAINIFPYNTSDSSVADAFEGYLNNGSSGDLTTSSFSVPCGNVAYFQVSSGQTVNFKSSYQILSSLFANSTYGYWSDSGQRFGPAASLPTASTSFPIASQDPLYWTPDPQSKNLLGLSKTGLASASCIIGQWYAFYNPAYNSNNTDWTTMDITGATVSITGSFSNIKIYPLEQVVDYQNGSFVGDSNDDYQSYFDGNIGSDGSVSFTNQNGVTDAPVAGGQNLLAPNEAAQSLVDNVVGLLQNIISEIKSLFSFGYEAINDLAGLMGDFASAVSGLYTWLPTEVHAALISAVSIAIVIGVFKVFI